MNKLLATAIATASIAIIPLAGVAAEGQKPKTAGETGVTFDTLDTNKDGRISLPEASADPKLVETFSTADKNGDGYLDSSEYANGAKQPKQ